MKREMGITWEHSMEVADILTTILADEFLLYTKTLDAHWNVEDAALYSQHLFFEKQYNQLFEIIDRTAECIRSLGQPVAATLSNYLEFANLTETSTDKNDTMSFIKLLLEDHQSIIDHIRKTIDRQSNLFKDMGTTDFFTGLMETHEKMAFMLRAHLNHLDGKPGNSR